MGEGVKEHGFRVPGVLGVLVFPLESMGSLKGELSGESL